MYFVLYELCMRCARVCVIVYVCLNDLCTIVLCNLCRLCYDLCMMCVRLCIIVYVVCTFVSRDAYMIV